MKTNVSNRRRFLKSAGAGFGALIGTSVFGKGGWLRPGPVRGMNASNSVTLRNYKNLVVYLTIDV